MGFQSRYEGSRLQDFGLLVQELHGSLDPLLLGISTDLLAQFGREDHSFPGTLAVGDSCVAVQILEGDLPIDHCKAAGDWDGNRI